MLDTIKLIKCLREQIGRQVIHQGTHCMVVELLEQPLCLILEATGAATAIQDNQFGTPHRLASRIFTIPCLDHDNRQRLHPDLMALGLELD